MTNKSQNKPWCVQRSRLEKVLMLLLLIAAFLIIGLLTFGILKLKSLKVCTTPACIQAAAQITTHVDPDTDPCDDFFKFACGKFIKNTHGDMNARSIKLIEDQTKRQLDEIIKEPIKDDDHFIVKSQKKLFQACTNKTAVEEQSIKVVKKHLEELGGWPVLLGHTHWREESFDWTRMSYKLKRLGYHYESMLGFSPIRDPVNDDKYILRVHEPYVNTIEDEHRELYKNYMTEVAIAFGAEQSQAKIEMEKVLDFMDILQKIIEMNYLGETKNITAELLSTKFTIGEYQNFNYKIDWQDFLANILYPSVNTSSSDYVVFPKTAFMDALLTLIKRTRKRIQANYMIWRLLENVIEFLPEDLKSLQGKYKRLVDESQPSTNRFDYCKSILENSFSPLPANIIYARRYLPKDKQEKVKQLLSSVKTELQKLLIEASWMDDESKEKAIEKTNNLVEVIGGPSGYLNDSIFAIHGKTQNENPEDPFLSLYLKRSALERDVLFDKINKPENVSEMDEYFFNGIVTVNAMYSRYDNTMVLPAAVLQGIFLDIDRPMYLNYGSIGSLIGHELTHGFCRDGSRYDKNGEENNQWTDFTEKAYYKKVECMIKDFDVKGTKQKINGTITLEENIADFTGVRLSYAAYQKWVNENGEEPKLPGIEYTPRQLFWISSVSHHCYKLDGEQVKEHLSYDKHALTMFRSTGPMKNNEDFVKNFNCPVGSRMNPSEKCQVF